MNITTSLNARHLQTPVVSTFGPQTSADEVMRGLTLQGRRAVVTGGHAGLGLETVRALLKAGAEVIVPARRPEVAWQALEALQGLGGIEGLDRVTVAELDLRDRDSIDAFAAEVVRDPRALDILINNAGIMATPLARDAHGHEMQWSVNHLGPFRLTARLWPALVRARGARVIMLSSGAHRFAAVDLEDPNFLHRPYDKWQAYGQSKTASALFALALDHRGHEFGVSAFSVHPGSIQTGLSQHLTQQDLMQIGALDANGQLTPAFEKLSKTIPQGAATTLWCATSAQLDERGGVYCEDCNVSPLLAPSDPSLHGVMPWACDLATAEDLWRLSQRQNELVFDCRP